VEKKKIARLNLEIIRIILLLTVSNVNEIRAGKTIKAESKKEEKRTVEKLYVRNVTKYS
jgi:hypothetical protein